jgi:hypothetical protein
MAKRNFEALEKIQALADGNTSSIEIAALTGMSPRQVRKYMTKYNVPRLANHVPFGDRNSSYKCGRRVALDGYAYVSAPPGHPHARFLPGKNVGRILEHRLVAEQKLGRYLTEIEVVDHIDGLTLHNHPDNLRVFGCNGEHLRETLAGRAPNVSAEGHQNRSLIRNQPEGLPRVDKHRQRKKAGVLRLHQTLRLALTLGTDSPYLLGTTQWTSKAGIDMSQRSTIERALGDLCLRWGLAQTL